MNSEQLVDFLANLENGCPKIDSSKDLGDEAIAIRRFLSKMSANTLLCFQYFNVNYTDVDLTLPVLDQLMSIYMKGGALRQYALQFLPNFVATYLLAVTKRQHKSAGMFEALFLRIYNEEINKSADGRESFDKRTEEVRIPTVRCRSIYHDPMKINSLPEISTLSLDGGVGLQAVLRIGPFPTIEHFNNETKYMILSRVLNIVNSSLCSLSEPVCRAMCLSTLSICHSGFSFAESNLRSRILGRDANQEVLDNFSKRQRQHVTSTLLMELFTGCYIALYNGMPDLALRAIDSLHQRARYEMFSDVLLVTNATRNTLLENPLSKDRNHEELMWRYQHAKNHRAKDCVTNASLRIKKMPEDIPIQEEPREKGKGEKIMDDLIEDIAGGVDHIKKKMHQLSHHRKKHGNKKEGREGSSHKAHKDKGIDVDELELSTIREEKGGDASLTSQSPPSFERPKRIEGEPMEIEYESKKNGSHHDTGDGSDVGEFSRSREHSSGTERGTFSVGSFRHMDSGSGTERSVDYP
ncbi:unnamed protein product, partial [Mesorhabditis spiculigera]